MFIVILFSVWMKSLKKISKLEQHVIDTVLAIRTEKGISQDDIAEALSVTRAHIGNIESPKTRSKYKLGHLNELAKCLRVRIWDLLPEAPFPPTSPKKK